MDLHSGAPYWLLLHGLATVVPPLDADISCDVLIIGSGITGALLADALVQEGSSVAVVDRRDLAQGSTMASTGMLQYDLDVPLHRLERMIGRDSARRAYHRGLESIRLLDHISQEVACPIERRRSLYFLQDASRLEELRDEFRARQAAGLAVEWIAHPDLRSRFGLEGAGAILSEDAAQCDPYALTHALLRRCHRRGVRIHDRTGVTTLTMHDDRVTAHTDRGPQVTAQYIVQATGYETTPMLPEGTVELNSTYVVISEPLSAPPALPERCLMWEYADSYLYLRWMGDRLMVGGEDDPFDDPVKRDSRVSTKAERLVRDAHRLIPTLALEPAFAWAGTFATTPDGLGYIGALPGQPRVLYALGFGGNGITCSALATDVLRDTLMGRHNPDAAAYRFGRRLPAKDAHRLTARSA